jgi:hypothetical protein
MKYALAAAKTPANKIVSQGSAPWGGRKASLEQAATMRLPRSSRDPQRHAGSSIFISHMALAAAWKAAFPLKEKPQADRPL